MSNWDDKLFWCWVIGWSPARVRAERRRFSGNTFYYARNKASRHFKVDPQQIEGEPVEPALGPPEQRKVAHRPWSWMKSEDKDEPKRSKGSGGKGSKKRKGKSAKKRRGKASRCDS